LKYRGFLRLAALGDERPLSGLTRMKPFAKTFASCARSSGLDDLLRASIDEILNDLLGREGRELVCGYLERNCSIGREDIPMHLPKFYELLEETFGKASKAIGRAIARNLYEKLGWEFQVDQNFEFFDCLEAARARMGRELVERTKSSSTES
jgi:hypothetical protein